MEDIINRGGNDIVFTFYNADPATGKYLDTDVMITQDGRHYSLPAGSHVTLHNGESMTLYPYLAHEFIIPEGGPALIGEVSMTNDDNKDNFFREPLGRYPTIEEDEAPYRLLCTEYPPAKN
jgi:D-lyxose ketol-isomerase